MSSPPFLSATDDGSNHHLLGVNGDLIMVGGRRLQTTVWRSQDRGVTWTALSSNQYSPPREDFAAATVTDPVSGAQVELRGVPPPLPPLLHILTALPSQKWGQGRWFEPARCRSVIWRHHR